MKIAASGLHTDSAGGQKLRLGSLGHIDAKRVKLDPSPSMSDLTIAQYHERIGAQLPADRPKLNITAPLDDCLKGILAKPVAQWESGRPFFIDTGP
jgi:hypothetical protein